MDVMRESTYAVELAALDVLAAPAAPDSKSPLLSSTDTLPAPPPQSVWYVPGPGLLSAVEPSSGHGGTVVTLRGTDLLAEEASVLLLRLFLVVA